MKQFLGKIAFRLLLLVGIWIALSRLIPRHYYLGPEYLRWETVFGAIEGRNETKLPKNLIIGDSGAEMGLDAKQLRAANFAIGGTSFPEGYYILKQLEDQDIDTVFLSYGKYHFQSMDCFYTRTDYFDFVDEAFLEEVTQLAQETGDSAYLKKNWPWLDRLKKTFYFDFLVDEFKYVHNMYDLKQYKWYFREASAIRDSMVARDYSYMFPFKACTLDSISMSRKLELAEGRFRITAVSAHYLSNILEHCKSKEIQVVWVNMPLNNHTEQPSKQYFTEFDHALRYLLPETAPIVPFRTLDHCEFRDFSHLHTDAARAHTAWLRSYLKDSLNPAPNQSDTITTSP